MTESADKSAGDTTPVTPNIGSKSSRALNWNRIDEILEFALAAPPERRNAFLKATCGGDTELRAEVESLLEHVLEGEGLLANMSAMLSGGPPDGTGARGTDELLGETIGRYEIKERLGGGMAAVYLAEDTLAQQSVVLKLTAPGLTGVELDEARLRIEREAFTEERVDHKGICRVLDSGRTRDARGFLVLEYCEGRTLQNRLAEAPLGVERAVAIARQLASALSAAHAVGMIHRDVKPSNVMVADDGRVKLLDFGVAKVSGEKLTRTGQVLGTLEYMSPEQVSARAVEPATDIWSLGLVLYETATGRHPFRKASRRESIRAISVADRLSPHLTVGTPTLDTLIEAMLDREPRNRPTALEVEGTLARA